MKLLIARVYGLPHRFYFTTDRDYGSRYFCLDFLGYRIHLFL